MKNAPLVVLFSLGIGACAADATRDDASVSVCESDVEGQRIAVNGVQLNRIAVNRIAVNGTELVGVRLAGEPRAGVSVVGVAADGRTFDLVVSAADDGLFELSHQGVNVCEENEKGLFVPGVWDEHGDRHDSDTLTTFACRNGVIAKCVLWGYAPEHVGAAIHQACTRMARADYCGDGISYTRDGTAIDVFDRRGIVSAANEPGFLFEAGWNESGAVCVSRPRYEAARPSCWRDLPLCDSPEAAVTHGALVMNASRRVCR
jgi:hypothetical protein